EFEKTMVIPAAEQNAEQLAAAERAADAAAAAVRLDPEEAAPLAESAAAAPAEQIAPQPQAAPAEPAHSATIAHSETHAGIDPSSAPNALPLAKLQVLSGAFAGRELELTKALTTLGRPGVQVAAITRRAEGYYIVHVESGEEDDYPLVNGQAIGPQARKLVDNDVVQLAGVKMGFFAA
ncbi:MAG: phosphopeptide-binding protein, partial [Gammaproteobacteria bacterium]|nr:phosphopeptide-binding protein [Gammaproteobacteria bacterium]